MLAIIQYRIFCLPVRKMYQLDANKLHQVGTSSLLIYMMHGHTYIKFCLPVCYPKKLKIKIYRVSQEECAILRESVPYVKLYRYNPKHLYPKLNGYGDNGQRKVGTSCISAYCTSTAVSPLTFKVQYSHPSH